MINFINILVLYFGLITTEHTQQTISQGNKNVLHEITLTPQFKTVQMNKFDSAYFNKLIKRFQYKDSIIIYSLTTLKISRNGKTYNNIVYQNAQDKSQYLIDLKQINKDNYYLAVNTQTKKIGIPGTGGISYHPTKSRNHVLCLNGKGNSNGVPIDHEMKGGFPKPKFTSTTISWYYK